MLKAGSVFDMTKLQWMNGVYIRALPLDELAARLEPYTQLPARQGARGAARCCRIG